MIVVTLVLIVFARRQTNKERLMKSKTRDVMSLRTIPRGGGLGWDDSVYATNVASISHVPPMHSSARGQLHPDWSSEHYAINSSFPPPLHDPSLPSTAEYALPDWSQKNRLNSPYRAESSATRSSPKQHPRHRHHAPSLPGSALAQERPTMWSSDDSDHEVSHAGLPSERRRPLSDRTASLRVDHETWNRSSRNAHLDVDL